MAGWCTARRRDRLGGLWVARLQHSLSSMSHPVSPALDTHLGGGRYIHVWRRFKDTHTQTHMQRTTSHHAVYLWFVFSTRRNLCAISKWTGFPFFGPAAFVFFCVPLPSRPRASFRQGLSLHITCTCSPNIVAYWHSMCSCAMVYGMATKLEDRQRATKRRWL